MHWIFLLFFSQAIVNEDTQGSITHLQAEIKRLKETLLQYQENSILKNPSTGSVNSGKCSYYSVRILLCNSLLVYLYRYTVFNIEVKAYTAVIYSLLQERRSRLCT